MLIQEKNRSPEARDIIDKIEYTLKLRLATLIVFFLAVSIIFWLNLFPYSDYTWLTVSVVALWVFSAFIFRITFKKIGTASGISNFYFIYSAIFEFGFLTITVYANGGIMWIGAIFYLFTIIYSNIVLSKIKGNMVSLIAFFWFAGLVLLEYFQVIPFIPFAEFRENLYMNTEYVVATLSFTLLTFTLAGLAANTLTDLLRKRTEELEKLKLKLEKSTAMLETRVRERTQELEELADNLDRQVTKRTEELEDKMQDLEKFQKLSVNRELKMIELKEEIKKIKNTDITSAT